jgi:dimethylamine/trimethylamine dehydrogenase
VPHSNGFGSHKPRQQARFRGTKAEGGWAAVCVEISSIDPESDRNPVPTPSRIWDEDDARNLAATVEEVHAHGALAGIELWYSGSHPGMSPGRVPPAAPSQLPSEAYPMIYPRELRLEEIPATIEKYVAAAARARDAGFDILYVYGGHSYGLPMQFLSPFYNRRTDEYGGSLENRSRFWIEAIEAVRDEVGSDCAVAVRIGIDPTGLFGISPEDAAGFVRLADPVVDLWDVVASSRAEFWLDMRPSRLATEDYQLKWLRGVRESTRKPIIAVQRFTSPDQMAEVVKSGLVDLVGGARPSIADPFIPRKIEEGNADTIRECIGCNFCLMRVQGVDHISCTQNATAGEEFRRGWSPERFEPAANADRDVLVVGGGVAGMECAIVLAKRGFRRVHLVEADRELGGYATVAASLPDLAEWRHLVSWRRTELQRLRNVEVITGVRLTAEEVRDYGAELVVVATGARWDPEGKSHLSHEPVPGADLPHVVTPEQLFAGAGANATRAVVYDCEGYFMGVGIAELLASRGVPVTYVTPQYVVAPTLDLSFEGYLTRRKLEDLGVATITETELRSIDASSCLVDRHDRQSTVEADLVVLATSRRSNDTIYQELLDDREALRAAGVEGVYAAGDCVSPRFLADAVFDGHRLGREIDSPDPMVPLPVIRERSLVHAADPRSAAPVAD